MNIRDEQSAGAKTVWTAISSHTDVYCGIGQTLWADEDGCYVAIRHNTAEGGYYSTCDVCNDELLTEEGKNFECELEAIDAFLMHGWSVSIGGTILCAECRPSGNLLPEVS